MQLNWTKFVNQIVVMVCATTLCALKIIDGQVWLAIVGPTAGYALGNGNSAFKGQTSEPMIKPKDESKEPVQ